MKNSSKQDLELKSFLLRHDPAGIVDPQDSARLERFIADRVFYQPQPQISYVPMADFFVIPQFLRGAFSWPVTLTGVMALGLTLGFFVASFSDTTPIASYNIAMNEPWQHLIH
jgi:hypothetical protein